MGRTAIGCLNEPSLSVEERRHLPGGVLLFPGCECIDGELIDIGRGVIEITYSGQPITFYVPIILLTPSGSGRKRRVEASSAL